MRDFRSANHNPEGCAGCRPVVFDPATGAVEALLTARAERAYLAATPGQRRAWHQVACLNSRDPVMRAYADKLVAAMNKEIRQDG
jgi:hypothetical protein